MINGVIAMIELSKLIKTGFFGADHVTVKCIRGFVFVWLPNNNLKVRLVSKMLYYGGVF